MKSNNESPFLDSKLLNKLLLLLILPSLLFGCNYPTTNNIIKQDRSQSLSQYSTPYQDIQFNLSLPQPLSSDEKINLVILDEVTGLPYNRQEYEMAAHEENNYTLNLSIPMFSIIKYRYEKVGEKILAEKQANGQDVRYRMYLVKESGVVNDFLSSWDSHNPTTSTGRFEAIVSDHETGAPLPDILVSAGGQLNFTDSNGLINFYGLPPGTHNILFYAVNGEYQTFQQGAVISEGKKTPAEIKLSPNKAVEVTFSVTPPNDAIGAPVYLAGNFSQFGNTFTDLQGSMSIDPNRMPLLTPQEDGKLTRTVTLYGGTDFRFKFTLGDGYWNAEINSDSELLTRQLIVPDQNITLELNIATWRAPAFQPITFETFIHPEIGNSGERYIQFKKDQWTEPIRLWPLGDGNYLYILYAPFEITTPITYRVCLTKPCDSEYSNHLISDSNQIEPSDKPLTRSISVDNWLLPPLSDSEENIAEAVFPYKTNSFHTVIELSPEMTPRWDSFMPAGIEQIKEINSDAIIFSPQWSQNQNSGFLQPELGKTPFSFELINYIEEAHSQTLDVGLFPQFIPEKYNNNSLDWAEQNDAWRGEWFDSYRRFILSYTKLADISEVDCLIIGGRFVLPALPEANPVYLQESLEKDWRSLIMDIREEYKGKLIWAVNAGTQMDPLPPFIDLFDEIYISIESPLTTGSSPTFEQIAYGFTRIIDNLIYEVYRSTLKPITIAIAYPSIEGGPQGCALLNNNCQNDGLFIKEELSDYDINVDQQALIYNAILPVAASREWITGISTRGFIPFGNSADPSSSISGKPAQDVIEYWYQGLDQD